MNKIQNSPSRSFDYDITKGGRRKIHKRADTEESYKKPGFRRHRPVVNIKDAWKILTETANEHFKKFDLDEYNEEAYRQMFLYFYGDGRFHGNLHKGLFVLGKVGTGKTEAFEIFNQWVDKIYKHGQTTPKFNIAHAHRVVAQFENEEAGKGGTTALSKYTKNKAWVFNDVGREVEEGHIASHYGKKLNIFKYLIDERYILFKDKGIVTHITTNFPIESQKGTRYFENFYGDFIDDRINEMFNTIIFKGNSRRK